MMIVIKRMKKEGNVAAEEHIKHKLIHKITKQDYRSARHYHI